MTSIRGWSKFQHFKDRRPPWIKLYRDLLDDVEWHELDGGDAKLLVMMWLIASENMGQLPGPKDLAFRLRISQKQLDTALKRLSHWVETERYQDDVNVSQKNSVADVSDHQETETETETEKEGERARAPSPRFELPDWVNRVHWDAWHAGPRRKGKTDGQKAVALEKLSAWRDQGEDHAGALQNAAAGGYQGLFLPDKGKVHQLPSLTVPSRPGIDPTLAKMTADALQAVRPSPEIRERMERLRRGGSG